MIDGVVFLTELSLGALLVVLALRVAMLVRNEPFSQGLSVAGAPGVETPQPEPVADAAPYRSPPQRSPQRTPQPRFFEQGPAKDRAELVTRLHILIGLQERDCREQGLTWQSAPAGVGGYAVAWLYGAACALCQPSMRHSAALQAMVAQIAGRKMPLRQSEAVQTLASLTGDNTLLACFRHGLQGAEYWSEHRYVPARDSLYDAITSNAFI